MTLPVLTPLDPQLSSEEELIASLEPLVQRIARRHAIPSSAMGREDYLQVLRLELVNAIRTWSPTRGASLLTHAYRCLTRQCLNARRDQRLLGYRANSELEMPLILSLDLVQRFEEDGRGEPLVDLIAGPGDTSAEAQARYLASRAWALADELLAHEPRILRVLELTAGRNGTPLAQPEIAKRFGVSQMSISRWLRQARAILLADPRSQEFVGD